MIPASLVVLGAGNVGQNLLGLVRDHAGSIAEREGVDLRVVSVTNRSGTSIDGARVALDLSRVIDLGSRAPNPILVDATAFEGAGALYTHALSRGLSIATANKLPFVAPTQRWSALRTAARAAGRGLYYETTVGADLPMLAPIADRLRGGDRVVRIEGSLSGTLGFLGDAVSRGQSFGGALETARARGYTEPDPAEDLSGRDVARKALISAREIGLELELDDVQLEPFPTDASALAELLRDGRVLRYLAVLDGRSVRVGPVGVDAAHPAAALRSTEALMSIHTERCGEVPIVIRGPGAGGAVTASGLLADILRASRHGAMIERPPLARGQARYPLLASG